MMANDNLVLAIAIPAALFLVGGLVLLVGAYRQSTVWIIGVKLIGVAVFLPLVLAGAVFLVEGTVIDPIGRVLSLALVAAGLFLIVRLLRLHPNAAIEN